MPEQLKSSPAPAPDHGELVKFPERKAGQAGRNRRRSFIIGGFLVLGVLVVIAIWWSLIPERSLNYTTAPVSQGSITRTITATGTVNPELTIIVGTYISGVIQELYCDYNTRVRKGQICAKIDPRPYQSAVDQAKANLAVARAQLEKDKANLSYTKVAFERASRLVLTYAISQDAFDITKNNYAQAEAQVAFDEATILQRQAALDAAQVNLDYTNIVSPVDGIVVSRSVTMGQTVAASFQTPTLFLIATDLTKMEVDTNVSEGDIGGAQVENEAFFSVDAFPKRSFKGTVSQVRQSPQTVQNVVTYDVIISVKNDDLALKPGMTASTRIIVDRRSNVIRVPNVALRYRPSGLARTGSEQSNVWVLRNGQPTAIAVVVGLEDDSFTEIVSGDIRTGDQVIIGEQAKKGNQSTAPRLRVL